MGKPKGESQGLEFLQKVRPAAMEHLLSFFAESARHLDQKTRFLISVVTKVINGSERGVRQYVQRALESGADPEEVIDAVLCAYPCAGLTKVVDAIDTILDMGVPGISFEGARQAEEAPAAPSRAAPVEKAAARSPARAAPAAPEDEAPPRISARASLAVEAPPPRAEPSQWIAAGQVADIPPICGRRVIAGDRDIAVFSLNGEIVAVDNRCPHKGGSLAEGVVVDGVVICPLHQWKYDLHSGRCPDRPKVAINTYPVKIEGNKIFVGL